MENINHAVELASAFSKNIRESLTEEELKKVIKDNMSNSEHICATHDFIDSNVCMIEAFLAVKGKDVDPQSSEDLELVNAAWKISKDNGFKN